MRIFSRAAIAAFAVGVALAGSASTAARSSDSGTPHKRILGYQDQVTGTFHPISKVAPDATITPTTGTVELTLTITLKTALPKGGSIICEADLNATSVNLSTDAGGLWTEEAYATATVNGSTATCTVNVPYSWAIPASSSTVENSVTGDYLVEMNNASTGTAGGTAVPTGTVRYSLGTFLDGAIPATGSTSKYPVSVVI